MNKLENMPRRLPMDGTFELTVRCNLKCEMCLFRHDDSKNRLLMDNEKTASEWIDMARQVAEAGTLNLLITGGEPLLRADFAEIYKGIYELGFIITLYTNATLINYDIKELFKKYPPHKIGVTIYGASSRTYEKVCKNKNAYDKMIEGIRFLRTLPSKLEVRCTIVKDNYDDVEAIEDLVKRELGKECKLTQSRIVYKSVRGGCGDAEACRLTPSQNVRLFLRRSIDEIKKIKDRDDLNIDSIALEFSRPKEQINQSKKFTILGCGAGMDSYTISWDGKLLGCQILDVFYTEPFEEGFEKAWENFPFTVKLPEVDQECKKCEIKELCNACYACRYAETGDLGGKPEYVCEDLKELLGLIKI